MNLLSQTFVPDSSCGAVFSVDNVEEMIADAKGRVLPIPGRPEYDASEYIMKHAVNRWKVASTDCVEGVHGILHRCVSESLVEQAVTNRFNKIKNLYVEITNDLLLEKKLLTIDRVTKRWEMEHNLFTTNGAKLQSFRNEFITSIKREIAKSLKLVSQDTTKLPSPATPIDASRWTSTLFDTSQSKLLCSDKVVETMANVMAYFHLKADAYADCVCSHVLFHLMGEFVTDLGNEVSRRIGVFSLSNDELHHLFSEGTAVSKYREELQRRTERQGKGLKLINDHLNHHSGKKRAPSPPLDQRPLKLQCREEK